MGRKNRKKLVIKRGGKIETAIESGKNIINYKLK